jgi:hypothetical protein
MTTPQTRAGLELRSPVKAGGGLIIRVEATPTNPSGLDLSRAARVGMAAARNGRQKMTSAGMAGVPRNLSIQPLE